MNDFRSSTSTLPGAINEPRLAGDSRSRAAAGPTRARWSHPGWWIGLVAIVALGLWLRTAWIAREALWGDEVFSRDVATQTYVEMLARVRADVVHPPLYYLVLNASTRVLGDSPTALRLPSLVFSALTIVALAFALRRMFGRRDVPLVAAALLAVSRLQILYGQEVRSYALYELLTVLVVWAAVEAAVRRTDTRRWVVFAIFAGIVVLTHNVGVLFVGATLTAVLVGATGAARRALVARWTAAVLPAAALAVAWTAYVVPAMRAKHGVGGNLGWIAPPGVVDWATLFSDFVGTPPVPHAMSLVLAGSAVVVGAALYATWRARSGRYGDDASTAPSRDEDAARARVATLTLLSCALVPSTVLFVVSRSATGISFWGERHLLPAAACWLSLIALGICTLASWSRGLGVLAGAAALAPSLLAAREMSRVPLRIPYDAAAYALSRPENRSVPAFTTAVWNVGAPTNRYISGRDTVAVLPDSPDAPLPPTFWLAYRPFQADERARATQIAARGWRAVDSVRVERSPDIPGGARLVRFERPPAAQSTSGR